MTIDALKSMTWWGTKNAPKYHASLLLTSNQAVHGYNRQESTKTSLGICTPYY